MNQEIDDKTLDLLDDIYMGNYGIPRAYYVTGINNDTRSFYWEIMSQLVGEFLEKEEKK